MRRCARLFAIALIFGVFGFSCSKEGADEEVTTEEEQSPTTTEEQEEPADPASRVGSSSGQAPSGSSETHGRGETTRTDSASNVAPNDPSSPTSNNGSTNSGGSAPTGDPSGTQQPPTGVSGNTGVHLTIGDVAAIGNGQERTVDIFMANGDAVAGFQFLLAGAALTGSTGGTASERGFQVSTSGAGGVIGFSFEATTIPPGGALLTRLSFVPQEGATELCLTEPVIADPMGESLAVTSGGCVSLN